jgi:hypothetical protein
MNTESDHARSIAERVARRVSAEPSSSYASVAQSDLNAEIAAVRSGIAELQRRLVQLETRASQESSATSKSPAFIQRSSGAAAVPLTHSPWLAGVNASTFHPSEERFGVEEAVVSELVDFFQSEKKCSLDPSGKPCDHCAMCSSRGF